MTAQTTTRTPAAGTRVAPMIVVIIAILAFAAGLALAQVVAPGTASVCRHGRRLGHDRARRGPAGHGHGPDAGTWPGVFRNPSIDDRSARGSRQRRSSRSGALPEGRNR